MVLKYPETSYNCDLTGKRIPPTDPAPLQIEMAGHRIMTIRAAMLSNAKTVRLILTRENPEDQFLPGNFQCLETFEKITE